MNFRTTHYGGQHPEVLAFDLPRDGVAADRLPSLSAKASDAGWYVLANNTREPRVNAARDAAGLVSAGGGRVLVSFFGITYVVDRRGRRYGYAHNDVRVLDLCRPDAGWHLLETVDFGVPTTSVAADLACDVH